MDSIESPNQDVMQVCRNGHVITARLRTCPEQGQAHCDRCGATTLDRCPTCGDEFPGAAEVPGLVFSQSGHRAPQHCLACGASFPWTERPAVAKTSDLSQLEAMLRRLPLVIRQLRNRHGDRPPFRVQDEHDLEDLVRAILPLHFDEIRIESRTPSYSSVVRSNFLLPLEATALVVKKVTQAEGEEELLNQLQEDADYYARQGPCRFLVAFIYDPEQRLRHPEQLEASWSNIHDSLEVRCFIGA